MWKPALAIALDFLIVAGCVLSLFIAITGGGTVEWGHLRITAHQLRNPFLFIGIAWLVRLGLVRSVPWPAFSPWTLRGIDQLAVRALDHARLALERLSASGAWVYCGGLVLVVLGIRLYLAWTHPGFFSGDDVEIQEMTFARLYGWDWQAWSLRNSFFPMGIVYPVQQAVIALGISGTHELVFAGRATVAVLSVLTLPLMLRGVTAADRPVGLIAITILATSAVWLHLGATELPRPVAAVFVTAAYFLVRIPTGTAAAGAGLLLGIAASFRFSELAFVPVLALYLLFERRFRDAAIGVAIAIGSAAAILGLADWLYWGEPFASVRAIFDYTIVQRQSSRGYEPPWYYLTELTNWTDWVVASLCVIGMRRHWQLALWIVLPLVLLSAMPHHEPRYVVPLLPLVALCAAHGLVAILRTLRDWAVAGREAHAGYLAVALVASIAGSVVFQATVDPVPSHDGAIALARAVRDQGHAGDVVVEESWRWGNRLYFGAAVRVHDLPASSLVGGTRFEDEVTRLAGDWIALRQDTCAVLQCAVRLARLGYEVSLREPSPAPHAYVVFAKRRP